MKKLIRAILRKLLPTHFLAFALLASSASAQTPAEVMAAHNAGVCVDAGLAVNCTDAAVLVAYCADKPAPCVDARAADAKVYSTAPSFRDAVILPDRYAQVFARKRDRVMERLARKLLNPAQCVVILTAAAEDVSVCK